jgi:hypothetical protein
MLPAFILAAGLSLPLAEPVTVVNLTGQPICQVYLSPAGTDHWAGQAWGSACLGQGGRRDFRPEPILAAPAADRRDLLVVFESGSERTYFGLDLRVFTHLVLGETEAEIFEWDPELAAGFDFIR